MHRRRAHQERAFIARSTWSRLDEAEERIRTEAGKRGWSRNDVADWNEIAEERRAARAHDVELRQAADLGLAAALDRLAGMPSSGEMSRRAPAELREACGFTRVMISSARGSRWLPDTIRAENFADPAVDEFDRFSRDGNEIPLARSMLETEMVRHRVAVIVEDAETDPRTYKPLVRVTQSSSYVAAPVTTNRRVIGFLHADRLGQRSEVTTGDLHSIDRFAAEFSVLFECAVLRERIDGQRTRMRELLGEVDEQLSALSDEPLRLLGGSGDSTHDGPADPNTAPRTALRDLLSRREQEVLTLLVAGATNRAIAQELVLSTETVKGHVSSILRKLRVSNRSEAAARYVELRDIEARKVGS